MVAPLKQEIFSVLTDEANVIDDFLFDNKNHLAGKSIYRLQIVKYIVVDYIESFFYNNNFLKR